MKKILLVTLFCSLYMTCYAFDDNQNNEFLETCQDLSNNVVLDIISAKIFGKDKNDARQEFQRYNKPRLSRIYDLLVRTLDSVYKTPLSITDGDYMDKSIRIQDKFIDSCVKIVSYEVEQEKRQANKSFITVEADVVSGIFPVFVKRFTIMPNNGVRAETSSSGKSVNLSYHQAIPAGQYPYTMEIEKGRTCTGTVYISGKGSWVKLQLYEDCRQSGVIGN